MSFELLILFIFLLIYVVKLNALSGQQQLQSGLPTRHDVELKKSSVSRARTIDCAEKRILCNVGTDCLSICSMAQGLDFSCQKGVCTAMKSGDIPTQDNNEQCNESHGVYRVLENVNEINITRWSCVSIYSELWNDRDEKNPGVCQNGRLETNVKDHTPRVTDCKCQSEDFLAYYNGRYHTP